jgi:hypothetical protein
MTQREQYILVNFFVSLALAFAAGFIIVTVAK